MALRSKTFCFLIPNAYRKIRMPVVVYPANNLISFPPNGKKVINVKQAAPRQALFMILKCVTVHFKNTEVTSRRQKIKTAFSRKNFSMYIW